VPPIFAVIGMEISLTAWASIFPINRFTSLPKYFAGTSNTALYNRVLSKPCEPSIIISIS